MVKIFNYLFKETREGGGYRKHGIYLSLWSQAVYGWDGVGRGLVGSVVDELINHCLGVSVDRFIVFFRMIYTRIPGILLLNITTSTYFQRNVYLLFYN